MRQKFVIYSLVEFMFIREQTYFCSKCELTYLICCFIVMFCFLNHL